MGNLVAVKKCRNGSRNLAIECATPLLDVTQLFLECQSAGACAATLGDEALAVRIAAKRSR